MEPKWKFRIDVQMTSTRWSPECLVKFSTYNIDLVNIGKWGCYQDRGNMVAKNNMNIKKNQTKLLKKSCEKKPLMLANPVTWSSDHVFLINDNNVEQLLRYIQSTRGNVSFKSWFKEY